MHYFVIDIYIYSSLCWFIKWPYKVAERNLFIISLVLIGLPRPALTRSLDLSGWSLISQFFDLKLHLLEPLTSILKPKFWLDRASDQLLITKLLLIRAIVYIYVGLTSGAISVWRISSDLELNFSSTAAGKAISLQRSFSLNCGLRFYWFINCGFSELL